MRWRSQPADPAHFWISVAPRSWPGDEGLWLDLARGGLGTAPLKPVETSDPWRSDPPEDVVYLPPVPSHLEGRRTDLASSLRDLGTPFLAQQRVGTGLALDPDSVVFDPLEVLITGAEESLASVAPGSKVVWPLIAGLTDDRRLWEKGLAALAAAGVRHVQPLAPHFEPAEKRRLVERAGEESFDTLFHGDEPDERAFSGLAAAHGFRPFLPRPLPPAGLRRENRRLAEQLAIAAELWLRLGRAESGGQDLFRSARLVDRERHDLSALCREGNLGVFPWLDALSSGVISDFVASGRASLVEELEAEYLRAAG